MRQTSFKTAADASSIDRSISGEKRPSLGPDNPGTMHLADGNGGIEQGAKLNCAGSGSNATRVPPHSGLDLSRAHAITSLGDGPASGPTLSLSRGLP